MLLSPRVYGSHAANQMRERVAAPVLVIGRDRFTRTDLAAVEFFSWVAAANLSAAMREIGAKSTEHVYKTIGPEILAMPRIGIVSLMVLGAAFEARGIGNIETWAALHRDPEKQRREFLTFHTIKEHEKAKNGTTKKARKRAKG